MPGSAPKGCPVEPDERAIRMVAEIRAGSRVGVGGDVEGRRAARRRDPGGGPEGAPAGRGLMPAADDHRGRGTGRHLVGVTVRHERLRIIIAGVAHRDQLRSSPPDVHKRRPSAARSWGSRCPARTCSGRRSRNRCSARCCWTRLSPARSCSSPQARRPRERAPPSPPGRRRTTPSASHGPTGPHSASRTSHPRHELLRR